LSADRDHNFEECIYKIDSHQEFKQITNTCKVCQLEDTTIVISEFDQDKITFI